MLAVAGSVVAWIMSAMVLEAVLIRNGEPIDFGAPA